MPLYTRPQPQAAVVPQYVPSLSATAWPAVNRAVFMRFQLTVPTPMRYLNWTCDVQSGNVQIGVVQLSGTDRTTWTRVMNSGVIACPAAGSVRTDLGLTLLQAGDFAMFGWADNVTFQTRYGTASTLTAMRICGVASSLASGVTTSGTLAWNNTLFGCALEADV